MATRRKSSSISGSTAGLTSAASMKYRPFVETGRWAAKGTRPVPSPETVPQILTNILIEFCKTYLYIPYKFRFTAYAILLFFFSFVTDYVPVPKSYFSDTGNIFNQWFVKYSWGWTFCFVGVYMYLTSSVLNLNNRQLIIRNFYRLAIATAVWFTWTNLFRIIEESTGQCLIKSSGGSSSPAITGRRACVKSGGNWSSFDISGHSFLLIWCVLFIIEETKAIIDWDHIQDHIRNEEYKRKRSGQENESQPLETPLSSLSDQDFEMLKDLYKKYSIPSKLTLFGLTILVLIWDLMIFMTAIYFHSMIEKIIGGFFGGVMWLFLYRGFYPLHTPLSPGMPGVGLFRYSSSKLNMGSNVSSSGVSKSSSSKSKAKGLPDDIPKFMGMPLYPLKSRKEDDNAVLRMENPVPGTHST